jgi:sensor histidine kinase regulating citrate/malate metabolism
MKRFANVIYTAHAVKQMKVRHVRASQVERCLEQPDSEVASYDGATVAEQKTALGATLRVVYAVNDKVATVVTVVRKRK